jgi:hypothetical protein
MFKLTHRLAAVALSAGLGLVGAAPAIAGLPTLVDADVDVKDNRILTFSGCEFSGEDNEFEIEQEAEAETERGDSRAHNAAQCGLVNVGDDVVGIEANNLAQNLAKRALQNADIDVDVVDAQNVLREADIRVEDNVQDILNDANVNVLVEILNKAREDMAGRY